MKLKSLKLPKAIESRGDNYLPAGWYIEVDDIGEVEVVLDVDKVANIIQLRYFKLMHPDIDEAGAKLIAYVLAQALVDNLKKVLVKKGEQ